MDILNVLEKATQINSVSGSENEIRKFISDNVKKYCDELSVDAMGNLIAHKKCSGKNITACNDIIISCVMCIKKVRKY